MFRIILLMNFITRVFSIDGSYNSFINQIGYCKMQSFDTISRNTTNSVPMFLDGRISFGVGISNENQKELGYNLCGSCINITHIDNFYEWDAQLTQFTYNKKNPDESFLVMVFDNCEDPICTKNFLDFDIYSQNQPVKYGNPTNLSWHFVPCPIHQNEFIQYLLCTEKTCKKHDRSLVSVHDIIDHPVEFWSLSFRNMRIPIKSAGVYYKNQYYDLRKDNSWTWNYFSYDLNEGINLTFTDIYNKTLSDFITIPEDINLIHNGYHGGILLNSDKQN